MDTSNTFSCFIIGEGTLPIQCAQILLDREHTIYGILSPDVAVHDWARERGIPHIDPKNQERCQGSASFLNRSSRVEKVDFPWHVQRFH